MKKLPPLTQRPEGTGELRSGLDAPPTPQSSEETGTRMDWFPETYAMAPGPRVSVLPIQGDQGSTGTKDGWL